jgi:hypothetical protein
MIDENEDTGRKKKKRKENNNKWNESKRYYYYYYYSLNVFINVQTKKKERKNERTNR